MARMARLRVMAPLLLSGVRTNISRDHQAGNLNRASFAMHYMRRVLLFAALACVAAYTVPRSEPGTLSQSKAVALEADGNSKAHSRKSSDEKQSKIKVVVRKDQEDGSKQQKKTQQQEQASKKAVTKKEKKVVPAPAFSCAAVDSTRTDDKWCVKNCNTDPPYCPEELCSCEGGNPGSTEQHLPSDPLAESAPTAVGAPERPKKEDLTTENCIGAECAGLGAGEGAGAGIEVKEEKKKYSCVAVASHCMPCGEPIPAIGGCNKNYDQSDCQADQCEWLGEFGPGCQMGESKETAVDDGWCATSCNAEPANCPEEKCECEGGNPMILNAGVERPPGMSKEANEIWTENEEKKQFSEREAVAKKEEVKRQEIEKAKAARDEKRMEETEKARKKAEKKIKAEAEAAQKIRDDGVVSRAKEAAASNEQAMKENKKAADEIAKNAEDMKDQAAGMNAASDAMKEAADQMAKQVEDMKKEADAAVAAQPDAEAAREAMAKQAEDMKKQLDDTAADQVDVEAAKEKMAKDAEDMKKAQDEMAAAQITVGVPAPSPVAVPVAPGTMSEQEMEAALKAAEKEHEEQKKAIADAGAALKDQAKALRDEADALEESAKVEVEKQKKAAEVKKVEQEAEETPSRENFVNAYSTPLSEAARAVYELDAMQREYAAIQRFEAREDGAKRGRASRR